MVFSSFPVVTDGFPIVFLWFSFFLWFPVVSLWYPKVSYGFLIVFLWLPMVSLLFSSGFPFSYGFLCFPSGFPWFSYGSRSRQNHSQKSRFNDFLALVPEVHKINHRSLDLMTFWPWLQKSTKSFPELSI